jgi:hypothetical protein
MVQVTITITGGSISERVSKNIDATIEQVNTAITAAMNMCRSMIEEQARSMISGSGNFGGRWIDGLHVPLDNMRISMSHDIPYADIFETGGTITGHPLLWLPIGGGPPAGSESLVSAKGAKKPLMLSITDKSPKLFGTTSVTIPKKWDLNGVVQNVMQNFADYFSEAMGR